MRSPNVIGIAAACTVALFGNLLVTRFDHRWDLTPDKRYTPSAPLRTLLERLRADVQVVVLLGHGDVLAPSIAQLLESYRSISPRLKLEWVDPDRDPAGYLARQAELGIREGRTEDGLVTTDALMVLATSERKYYLTPEEITGLDPEHSDGGSSFEHAFAVGISSLFRQKKPEVCFTEGHRELRLEDRSPEGLSQLKLRVERDAMSPKAVDLTQSNPDLLAGCRVIVVAAPDIPLSARAVDSLAQAAQSHASLLLLGGLLPNAEGKLQSVGLEPLARLGGIEMPPNLVVEQDEAYQLPGLFGGTFFATPVEHPINRGLLRSPADAPLRVVVALAQRLSASPGSPAQPLLTSSRKSVALANLGDQALERADQVGETASYSVAMASQLPLGNDRQNRIVVGPVNLVQNRTLDNPALVVNQSFVDSLLSYLAADPGGAIEVVARSSRPQGLQLSAQDLAETTRYVVFVMPAAVLLAALGVYWQRRKDGRVPRRQES